MFHDLSFSEIVCCPQTEAKLSQVESWLYSSDEIDALYPKLCDTAILQPNIDWFLQSEVWSISRAIAEIDTAADIKNWFFSRYGFFNSSESLTLDTQVLGEGYPGFWDCLELPEFIKLLELQTPESLIMDIIGDHHPQIGLDLGCGQGGMLQLMSENCRQVLGLETNFYLAATANRLLRASEIPIRYFIPEKGYRNAILEKNSVSNAYAICGDVVQMPFCEPLFDWVHCGHILDLLDDPAEVLIQIKRIMKPGGTLSICTPWDFDIENHFDNMLEILSNDFEEAQQMDGIPWLRFNHKRRFVLHEDWIWVGKLKTR